MDLGHLTAPKETLHLHCTCVALQKIGPQSQKEEFAFSALIQMQVHLPDFWQKNFRFLLSSVTIRSDKMSCLFLHFTVWYSFSNLQYEQSLWKHYKQNNLLKKQTRTRRAGVGQDEDIKLILEGGKTWSWERDQTLYIPVPEGGEDNRTACYKHRKSQHSK